MLIFRQLFDNQSSKDTYLLGDSASGEALLIDPVFEQVLTCTWLLRMELGLHLTWTLDTHVHADHVTGAWLISSAPEAVSHSRQRAVRRALTAS